VNRVLVATVLLPVLFGSLVLWSLSDRVDRIDSVPAAVVNLDEPVKTGKGADRQTIAAGRLLAPPASRSAPSARRPAPPDRVSRPPASSPAPEDSAVVPSPSRTAPSARRSAPFAALPREAFSSPVCEYMPSRNVAVIRWLSRAAATSPIWSLTSPTSALAESLLRTVMRAVSGSLRVKPATVLEKPFGMVITA